MRHGAARVKSPIGGWDATAGTATGWVRGRVRERRSDPGARVGGQLGDPGGQGAGGHVGDADQFQDLPLAGPQRDPDLLERPGRPVVAELLGALPAVRGRAARRSPGSPRRGRSPRRGGPASSRPPGRAGRARCRPGAAGAGCSPGTSAGSPGRGRSGRRSPAGRARDHWPSRQARRPRGGHSRPGRRDACRQG